jgi:putative solute:sodium symporter small subunit
MNELDKDQVRAVIAARAAHWARARRLTAVLLLLWLVTTVGTVFYARELAGVSVFGWPLSFYLAAQGAALVYLAILGVYALAMARLDRRFARTLAQSGVQP